MFSEKGLHKFGTPLPLLELDEVVPSKKPVYAQDQIATDEQGRRRFHGAFTGGFSAGYWNTVGSKEGWTPQAFKSSRSEKAAGRAQQRPEDFMDDEDREIFGIGPKGLQIQDDFTGSEVGEQRKRKFLQTDLKPIPGEPVLHQLLKPVKDKVAVRILKAWGWRPGQGLGPRQTRKEKKKARERNKRELYLLEKYGCDLPTTNKTSTVHETDDDEDDEDDDSDDEEITFAPEDYEAIPYGVKTDRYGLGYTPLSRQSVLGGSSHTSSSSTTLATKEHFNLFKPLEALGKNNKKISFAGEAFGVGALEEDDDHDVYGTDDLTRYDYSLEDKKKPKKTLKTFSKDEVVLEDFLLDLNPDKTLQYKVDIPFGWQPRNWYQKRSRFAPLDPRAQRNLERKFGTDQEDEREMTREKRAEILGEELKKKDAEETAAKAVPQSVLKPSILELQKQQKERQQKTQSLMEKITAKSSSFTKGGIITLEGEEKSVEPMSLEDISSSFKPFVNNEAKQKRYEQFLAANLTTNKEIEDFLKTIQPVELSLWDRQMEQKEFVQASKLYRPLKGIMSDRFVTESAIQAEQKVAEIKRDESKQIFVERSKIMWKPHSLLCKRFNIAEPFGGLMEDEKKKSKHKPKMSVFDYLETSVNKKTDFQTPVIIPKHIEKPKEIVKQQHESKIEDKKQSQDEEEQVKEPEPATLEWQDVLQGKERKTDEKSTFTFKPKTDLERKVVESLDKSITDKKELFKSIFSDSETDDEEEKDKPKDGQDELVTTPLSKPLNAAAANLLRNNSPPRGIFKALFNVSATVGSEKAKVSQENESREGQEKALEPTKEMLEKPINPPPNVTDKSIEKERILFKPKASREPKDKLFGMEPKDIAESTIDLYGPALPNTLTKPNYTTVRNSLDDKLMDLINKQKASAAIRLSEVWVEKEGAKNDSTDSDDDSTSDDSSSTAAGERRVKHKKKSKKAKKKKSSSEHKHKKHKDHHKEHKSSKKSKKSDKKKKHKKK